MPTARADSSYSESQTSKIGRTTEQRDQLSNLPEAIIYYILSFVSTLDAVRTTVLAKRWRYVWTQIPNLYIDDSCFPMYDTKGAFVNFVNGVHCLYKAPRIEAYTLFIRHLKNSLFIDDWVRFAIQMDVRKLTVKGKVFMAGHKPFQMPCLRSITDLNLLLVRRVITLNSTGLFSSLEKLSISYVIFDDNTIFDAISHRCPLLKSLIFKECLGLVHLDFTLPLLEVLEISRCRRLDRLSLAAEKLQHLCIHDSFAYGSFTVKILAPNLQNFEWLDCIFGKFSLGNFTCLRTAHISLIADSILEQQGPYLKNATKLLNSLASAGSVTLEMACFWSLSTERPLFVGLAAPPDNIKHIKLFVDLDADVFRKILYLFKICPNLETLKIRTFDKFACKHLKSFLDASLLNEGNLACTNESRPINHPEEVIFNGFRGEEYEIEFVEFLLKRSEQPKRITVLFAEYVSLSHLAKISIDWSLMQYGFGRGSTYSIVRVV